LAHSEYHAKLAWLTGLIIIISNPQTKLYNMMIIK